MLCMQGDISSSAGANGRLTMRENLAFFGMHSALALFMLAACGGNTNESEYEAPTSAAPVVHGDTRRGDAEKHNILVQSSSITKEAEDTELSIREEVALLRYEIAAIRLQLAHMPRGMEPYDTDRDARTEEAARIEAERSATEEMRSREADFRSEFVDPAWSRITMDNLRRALRSEKGEETGGIESIECRSRSCKVVVDIAVTSAAGQDVPVTFSQLAHILPNLFTSQIKSGDGRQMMAVYLSR